MNSQNKRIRIISLDKRFLFWCTTKISSTSKNINIRLNAIILIALKYNKYGQINCITDLLF